MYFSVTYEKSDSSSPYLHSVEEIDSRRWSSMTLRIFSFGVRIIQIILIPSCGWSICDRTWYFHEADSWRTISVEMDDNTRWILEYRRLEGVKHTDCIISILLWCIRFFLCFYFLFCFLRLERLPLDQVFFIESLDLFLIFDIELFELTTLSHENIEESIDLLIRHGWKNIEPILFLIVVDRFTSYNKIYKIRIFYLNFIKESKCKITPYNLCHRELDKEFTWRKLYGTLPFMQIKNK